MQQHVFSRVACYVRVSTENQLENYSIGEQTERLKAYCKAKGWTIYNFYPDPGYSGGNENRPALQQMIKDIHAEKIDMVAVYKLDRLSRSQKDTLTLLEDEFIANNVEFVSISENFDTSTPFGRAMIGILSVFAQLEKDQITERFTMGRIGRSKAGYYHGGPTPPTGYDYVNGKLIKNEFKSQQVQEVYQRFLNGCSIHSIQNYMHEKYGGWNSSALVLNILRNSVYIGKVKFKGVEYDGLQEPIIDKATFQQTQKLLKSPDRYPCSAQKTPFRAGYLLSSLIFCKRCGARYSANHGYYKCYSRAKCDKRYIKDPNCKNDNFKIKTLDNIVIAEIRHLKYDHTYLENITGKANQHLSQTQKALFSRIDDIDKQIGRMIDLYQLGTIPMTQISGRISKLEKEKNAVAKQLASKKEAESAADQRKELIHVLSEMNDVFLSGSLQEKRLLVSTLIESVWVDGSTIDIKWRI